MRASTIIDYAIFPVAVLSAQLLCWWLLGRGVPNLLVTPIVVAPYVGLAWLAERTRPERPTLARDYSLVREVCHFIFNFELGYGAALGALWLLERLLQPPASWPTHWPMGLQVLVAVALYEGTSYWQHRLFHRRARLWPFHALHHSGQRLDLIRAGRFHAVDFATVAFVAFLPLMALGVTDDVITMLAVLVSVLGVLHHGNVRQRTPAWLGYLFCTPAVHRRHHSASWAESDANFGNTVMIFDVLFGTYAPPHPVGPATMGIDRDQLPAQGFWQQALGPFRTVSPRPSAGGAVAAHGMPEPTPKVAPNVVEPDRPPSRLPCR